MHMEAIQKRLYSRREACEFLGIGPTTLWQLTRDRRLAAVRIGRRVLYQQIDLEQFIERASRASSRA